MIVKEFFFGNLRALIVLCIILWAFAVVSAFAQEQPPRERALMERIGMEVNGNLACATTAIALQDNVRQLEKKLAEQAEELKKLKTEPKPPE